MNQFLLAPGCRNFILLCVLIMPCILFGTAGLTVLDTATDSLLIEVEFNQPSLDSREETVLQQSQQIVVSTRQGSEMGVEPLYEEWIRLSDDRIPTVVEDVSIGAAGDSQKRLSDY